MGKILGLDVGTKRIGIALSDIQGTISFPRGTIKALPQSAALQEIKRLIEKEHVTHIVIGVPLNEDNQETPRCRTIREFGKKLTEMTLVPIIYVDEFGSTKQALRKIPLKRDRKKKGIDDAIAAHIILERYLQ